MGCAASKQEKKGRPWRGQIKARIAKSFCGCASPKACHGGDGNDNGCNDCIGVGTGIVSNHYTATDGGKMLELKSNHGF